MHVKTHIIFLGTDETDPEKPILESACGLLDIQTGSIIKIKNQLYQVSTFRQRTKTEGDINLTMQFINVKPTSPQKVWNQIANQLN